MPTKIDYVDETWNPVTGCAPDYECWERCYARRMARRLAGRFGYPEAPNHFDVTLHPERLQEPLRWRKPRRVLTCSMGDLFHADVEWADLCDVWNVMRQASQHTFLVLTKRPQHMLDYVMGCWLSACDRSTLPNVWLGVSVSRTADLWRVEELLKIPAAVRWVSFEPALEEVDFTPFLPIEPRCPECDSLVSRPKCMWELSPRDCPRHDLADEWRARKRRGFLDWIVCGAETGPGARASSLGIFWSVRAQCQVSGIPFWWKGRKRDGETWHQLPED